MVAQCWLARVDLVGKRCQVGTDPARPGMCSNTASQEVPCQHDEMSNRPDIHLLSSSDDTQSHLRNGLRPTNVRLVERTDSSRRDLLLQTLVLVLLLTNLLLPLTLLFLLDPLVIAWLEEADVAEDSRLRVFVFVVLCSVERGGRSAFGFVGSPRCVRWIQNPAPEAGIWNSCLSSQGTYMSMCSTNHAIGYLGGKFVKNFSRHHVGPSWSGLSWCLTLYQRLWLCCWVSGR